MAQESWKREEETNCQAPEGPVLCANNCGFFGSVTTMNLCSKCYRDVVLKQSMSSSPTLPAIDMSPMKSLQPELNLDMQARMEIQFHTTVEASAVEIPEVVLPSPSVEPVNASAGDGQKQQQQRQQQLPNRCLSCRKRVGLTGFKCKCGDVFCSLHRYSDKHNCSFDYKAAGRDAIAKANPVVKADKIGKI